MCFFPQIRQGMRSYINQDHNLKNMSSEKTHVQKDKKGKEFDLGQGFTYHQDYFVCVQVVFESS